MTVVDTIIKGDNHINRPMIMIDRQLKYKSCGTTHQARQRPAFNKQCKNAAVGIISPIGWGKHEAVSLNFSVSGRWRRWWLFPLQYSWSNSCGFCISQEWWWLVSGNKWVPGLLLHSNLILARRAMGRLLTGLSSQWYHCSLPKCYCLDLWAIWKWNLLGK